MLIESYTPQEIIIVELALRKKKRFFFSAYMQQLPSNKQKNEQIGEWHGL